MTRWQHFRRWWFRRKIRRTGRVIDFTVTYWGHNIDRSMDSSVAWSTPKLQNGDVIITKRGRFLVYGVRDAVGVDDMTFFETISEAD